MNRYLLSLCFLVFIACSPLGAVAPLGQNTFGDAGSTGFTPDGQENVPTVTFGQLSAEKCRVTIPLSVLGVTVDELATLEVAVVYEDESERAYELDPVQLYNETSDAIVFVVNQLNDGDVLSITLALPERDVTFEAAVSEASEVTAVQL